ncbi:MAG: hypothetical protein HY066_01485 [Betaproteobacteria bacterium]|nr:hypothetical protein [Betaproteobacteria bacterium]
MRKQLVALFCLVFVGLPIALGQERAALSGSLQAPARAEVLVLGAYHMANPGHDIFNMHADDVLAPKRQAEIVQVIAILKKFNPTKIAVERDSGDKRLARDYPDYLAGKYELTRNEIEQIGYRLAKVLGLKTIYGVDADGEFPHPRVIKYAKATGRSKEFDALMADMGAMIKTQSGYLASHTILETLLYMNSDDKVAEAVGYYYREAHFGEEGDWAGADLVSDWFRRNMRIYSNIVQLADSPNERILVVYGAGHLGWLRTIFASDPTFRLRKLTEFVK